MNDNRKHFPLLQKVVNGYPLVYLDNAATTLKPLAVITAIATHYEKHAGNPGRALHTLALEAEQVIKSGRKKVLELLHAPESYATIFTKSATESINLIASSLAFTYRGDKKPHIITTVAEHHSNFLPWLRLQKEYGFHLEIVPVLPTGEIDLETLEKAAKAHPESLIAITHCSNVTGIITNLPAVIQIAKKTNAKILLDASQSIGHMQINLLETPVDYFVASIHKMYGLEGVGVLVMKKEEVATIEPLLVGGGMVETASQDDYTWRTTEARLEGGTPHTAGIAGMIAAIDFIRSIGLEKIQAKERNLQEYFSQKIQQTQLPGVTFHNNYNVEKNAVFIFSHATVHPHDISDFLDQYGIAVRSGYHCAEPLHQALNLKATTRVSLSFLNTTTEIDYFFAVLQECLKKFA